MGQLHKRFTNEQVKLLLEGYVQGRVSRSEVEGILEINKPRFFALMKDYRRSPARLSSEVEEAITRELLREKALVDNPNCQLEVITTQPYVTVCRKGGFPYQSTLSSKGQKT